MQCIRYLTSYSQPVRYAAKALQSISERKPFNLHTLSPIFSRNLISISASATSVLDTRYKNVNRGLIVNPSQHRSLSTLLTSMAPTVPIALGSSISRTCMLSPATSSSVVSLPPQRSVTKWSLAKGRRQTVKAVIRRFKRLDWGMWVRPRQGASKKIWKKGHKQRRRIKEHVFTNATQSTLLDKMVTRYWRKSRHYPDDPYAPYHKRPNFRLANSRPMKN